MSQMKDKTLLELFNASDEMLADFVREAIENYYEMKLDRSQVGITALEKFKDSLFLITISGDIDD